MNKPSNTNNSISSEHTKAQNFWHVNLPKFTLLNPQFQQALFEIKDNGIQTIVLKIIKGDISNLTNKAKNPQNHSQKIHTSISKALIWGLLSDCSSYDIEKKIKIADSILLSLSPLPQNYFQERWTILTLTEALGTHLCVGALFRICQTIANTSNAALGSQKKETILLKTTQEHLNQLDRQLAANLAFLKKHDEKSFQLEQWITPFVQRIESFSPIKKINASTNSKDFNENLSNLYLNHSEKLLQTILKSNLGAQALNESTEDKRLLFLFDTAFNFSKVQQSHQITDLFFQPTISAPFSEEIFSSKFITSLKKLNSNFNINLPFNDLQCVQIINLLISANQHIGLSNHPISVSIIQNLLEQNLINKDSITNITKNSPEQILKWLFKNDAIFGNFTAKLTDFFIKFDFDPKYVNEQGESILYLLNKKATDFEKNINSISLYFLKQTTPDALRKSFAETFRILLEKDVPLHLINLQIENKKIIANQEMLNVFEIFEQQKLLEISTPKSKKTFNKKNTL